MQRHGPRTAGADGGIPALMRSCTNMLKSKMGMPATPVGLRASAAGGFGTETALEAVGPVLESVLANLTAVGGGWVPCCAARVPPLLALPAALPEWACLHLVRSSGTSFLAGAEAR